MPGRLLPIALLTLALWLSLARNLALTLVLALAAAVIQLNSLDHLDGRTISTQATADDLAVTALIVVAAAAFDMLRSRRRDSTS
jgi:hypothetical protein